MIVPGERLLLKALFTRLSGFWSLELPLFCPPRWAFLKVNVSLIQSTSIESAHLLLLLIEVQAHLTVSQYYHHIHFRFLPLGRIKRSRFQNIQRNFSPNLAYPQFVQKQKNTYFPFFERRTITFRLILRSSQSSLKTTSQ